MTGGATAVSVASLAAVPFEGTAMAMGGCSDCGERSVTTGFAAARPRASAATSREDPTAGRRMTLFAVSWALAALFHLAGNGREVVGPDFQLLGLVQLAVGVAAVWTLSRPRRLAPVTTLCAIVPVSAWFEAPVVGNHWVLAALVSLTFLSSVSLAHRGSGASLRDGTWRAFAPAARLTLLLAYGFAAFSKLNSGFFDPDASCAVYYGEQLLRSWGLGAMTVTGAPVLGRLAAPVTVLIESSIPVLLLGAPRMRRVGVLLALSFHWLLALDFLQHFWDFTSVLFALFLLFLTDDQAAGLADRLRRIAGGLRPAARRLAVTLGCAVAGIVTVASVMPTSPASRALPVLLGHAAWIVMGTTLLAAAIAAVIRNRPDQSGLALRPAAALLYVVPVLVVLNGLSPYLELKTGYGWNMYSNLRTVDGESNHLLVPATLDVTGAQGDRVTVLASSDAELAGLGERGYTMVWSEFNEWASVNPDASVTYRRGGELHEVARVGDAAALGSGVSALSRRLQPFRVVDESGVERCLTHFTAGR